MGEANCRLAMVALFVGLLVAGAEDEPLVQVYPFNGGPLCASECSTCPLVCSSPPSPPSPIPPPPSLPSSPDFSYATPPMPLLPPPSLPPPPPPAPPSPLSYIYPQTPSTYLPPPSPDHSPIYPYPYYFFYSNSGAPAVTVVSPGLDVLIMFSTAAISFLL